MMCFKYRKLIIPYSEEVLDERTRAKMEAHLASCESCRRELEAVQSVSSVLLSMDEPAVEPAPDLWARVSAQIATEAPAPAPRPWLRVTQAASALAAAALVAVVAVGIFNRTPETAPRTGHKQVAVVRDQSEPVALKAVMPKPKVIFQDGHVERMPKPVTSPAHPTKPQWNLFAKVDKTSVRGVKPASVTDHSRVEKVKDKPVEIASADIPSSHYAFKSLSGPDGLDNLNDSVGRAKAADTALRADTWHADYSDAAATVPRENGSAMIEADAASPAPGAPGKSLPFTGSVSSLNIAAKPALTLDAVKSYDCATAPVAMAAKDEETAVDALNRTEGVHIAAMFQYP